MAKQKSTTIEVSGTPPGVTFTRTKGSLAVASNGDIVVPNDTIATITFEVAAEASWNFLAPYFTIDKSGPVETEEKRKKKIKIKDTNTTGTEQTVFKYTLYTDGGKIDPRLVNDTGG